MMINHMHDHMMMHKKHCEKGNCYDNAPMESFWGKLKQEWLNGQHFHTREEAKAAIFWYIEVFYLRQRPHQTCGYMTPEEYKKAAANF